MTDQTPAAESPEQFWLNRTRKVLAELELDTHEWRWLRLARLMREAHEELNKSGEAAG